MAVAVAPQSPGFPERKGASRIPWRWPLAILILFALAVPVAVYGHAQPSFDPNGWLTWGRQLWHGNFNLFGAPSWKPLTFVFTFPYAIFGHSAELWLWILTATASGLAVPVLAGRLAWRLSPRGEGWMPGWLPGAVGALIAAAICVTMTVAAKSTPISAGYLRQILTVLSDPLDTALCLLAIDRFLSQRYGWTLFVTWLAALGRPEVWPFLLVYCIWAWFKVPRLRLWAVASVVSILPAWYVPQAIAAHSWNSGQKFDQGLGTAIVGNKFSGEFTRLRTMFGRAPQVEIAASVLLVFLRGNRRAMALVGLALVWALIETAFAIKGLSAVQRYILEPAAVLAVIGGVGVAHALAWPAWRRLPLNLIGVVATIGFLIASIPFAKASVNGAKEIIVYLHNNDVASNNLSILIDRAGGADRLKACGYPVVTLGWQSALAWHIGANVGDIGFGSAQQLTKAGQSAVVYDRIGENGWKLDLVNLPAAAHASCAGLNGLTVANIDIPNVPASA